MTLAKGEGSSHRKGRKLLPMILPPKPQAKTLISLN